MGLLNLVGKVMFRSGDKTVRVAVDRLVRHPIYKKYVRKTKQFLVHDETNSASVGDFVKIQETTKISKRKHFTLLQIIQPVAKFFDGKTLYSNPK